MKKTQNQSGKKAYNKKSLDRLGKNSGKEGNNFKDKKNKQEDMPSQNPKGNMPFKKKKYSEDDRKKTKYQDKKENKTRDWKRPQKREGFTYRNDEQRNRNFIKTHQETQPHLEETIASEDWIEGRNSVMEALKAGREINKILVTRGEKEGSIFKMLQMARKKGILIQEVERVKLDSVTGGHHHQGIVAYVAAKEYVDIEEILNIAKERKENPLILILDGITDPQNFGSILRSASCAGVHGVIIPQRRSVSLNSVVSKASAGAIEYVPVARVKNLSATIDELKECNLWIVGTDLSAEKTMAETDLKGNVAIVIGSEGEGMSRLVREKCDFLLKIPMKGEIASLNAGVACGVILYEALRQRGL